MNQVASLSKIANGQYKLSLGGNVATITRVNRGAVVWAVGSVTGEAVSIRAASGAAERFLSLISCAAKVAA